jgi:dynein heavy chain
MQVELEALQPELKLSAQQTSELMSVIAVETEEANKQKAVVEVDEAEANRTAQAAQAIKDECDADLAVAIPILESAIKALNTLTKNDMVELKAMKKPPAGVKLVMEAICVMKGVAATRLKVRITSMLTCFRCNVVRHSHLKAPHNSTNPSN